MGTATRAVVYSRVSTKGQKEDGSSLESQEEACRHYCEQHGMEVVDSLAEDISGTIEFRDRPEGARAYAMLAEDAADVLVIHEMSRLTRPPAEGDGWDVQTFIRGLTKVGKEVHFCDLGKLGGSFGDIINAVLHAESAGDYRRKALEAMSRGKRDKAKNGRYVAVGRAPFGYARQIVPGQTTGLAKRPLVTLAIEDRAARIVVFIFHWFLFGDETGRQLSGYQIAKKLTRAGITSPGAEGKSARKRSAPHHWGPDTVLDILRNETYSGTWSYQRETWSKDQATGKRIGSPRKEEDWIRVTVPAIVTRDVWTAAQERLKAGHVRTVSLKREYLLQSRLKCADCNHTYVGDTHVRNGKPYGYYKCTGKTPGVGGDWEHHCEGRNLRVDVVDRCVWQWIVSILEDPQALLDGLKEKQAEQEESQSLLRERLAGNADEMEDCRARLGNLIDLSTARNVSPKTKELFQERETLLNSQMQALERERRELEARIAKVVISNSQIDSIDTLARRVHKRLTKAPPQTRRTLVEMLDVRGRVKKMEDGKGMLELSCMLSLTALFRIEGLLFEKVEPPATIELPSSRLLVSRTAL